MNTDNFKSQKACSIYKKVCKFGFLQVKIVQYLTG